MPALLPPLAGIGRAVRRSGTRLAAWIARLQRWREGLCRLENALLSGAERLIGRVGVRSNRRRCPCCGWTGLAFRSFAVIEYRRCGVRCPDCGSFERHRALFFFYPRFLASLPRLPERLIHFAPEPCLQPLVASLCQHYQSSTFGEDRPGAPSLDLTRLQLPDESVDVLLMNHVLDCVPTFQSVPSEMHRVLRPGGLVLAIVSLQEGTETRELVAPASNQCCRVFGRQDLGRCMAPFAVGIVDIAASVDAGLRERSGLEASEPVVVLEKAGPRPG
jgi:hypothetical protein